MIIDISFWNDLIIPIRLSTPVSRGTREYRSVFDMDHDRIMYSNFFRRMHDKTQVFPYAPLSTSGQARSRLSHSLEVSCVARSLGMLVGDYLKGNDVSVVPHDVGMVCASACLAHDIGNPPFGHSGEFAIQHWCKENLGAAGLDQWERADFDRFEGNAQGFRILTRLETWQRAGGLRPTVATMCAYTKYPCSSLTEARTGCPKSKKYGYFKADRNAFSEVFSAARILPADNDGRSYPRHPLAYLTEAADDICYAVVDLEDAFHLGIISFDQIYDFLMPIASSDPAFEDEKHFDSDIRIARLRSATINSLINQSFSVIIESIHSFEKHSFTGTVTDRIESAEHSR
ncbi:MAG: dGTP triphosphohydrolase, partial [Spirochaetota bacterium]